jgi:hypothetical protein
MTCYLNIAITLMGAAFLFGFGLGALVAWDCLSRMPQELPKNQEWSDVTDEKGGPP